MHRNNTIGFILVPATHLFVPMQKQAQMDVKHYVISV